MFSLSRGRSPGHYRSLLLGRCPHSRKNSGPLSKRGMSGCQFGTRRVTFSISSFVFLCLWLPYKWFYFLATLVVPFPIFLAAPHVVVWPFTELNLFFIYSFHMNTRHLNTWFTWILDAIGVRYSNGKVMWLGGPFEYRTFWTINKLFSVRFLHLHLNTRPFDNRTQIYQLNTRLSWY